MCVHAILIRKKSSHTHDPRTYRCVHSTLYTTTPYYGHQFSFSHFFPVSFVRFFFNHAVVHGPMCSVLGQSLSGFSLERIRYFAAAVLLELWPERTEDAQYFLLTIWKVPTVRWQMPEWGQERERERKRKKERGESQKGSEREREVQAALFSDTRRRAWSETEDESRRKTHAHTRRGQQKED